jgi:hypothetical protein
VAEVVEVVVAVVTEEDTVVTACDVDVDCAVEVVVTGSDVGDVATGSEQEASTSDNAITKLPASQINLVFIVFLILKYFLIYFLFCEKKETLHLSRRASSCLVSIRESVFASRFRVGYLHLTSLCPLILIFSVLSI